MCAAYLDREEELDPPPPPQHRDSWVARHELDAARTEADRLRAAIRTHRDQRGDDRCWLDDLELYKALGEGEPDADQSLPPRCEFLASCERYWAQRQPHIGPAKVGRTIAQLEAAIDAASGDHSRLVIRAEELRAEVARLGRERDAARAERDAILRCAAQHARPGSLWQIGSGWCAERLANGYETVHRADSPEAAIRLAAGLAPDAGGGGAR